MEEEELNPTALRFDLEQIIQEGHRNPIYCIRFCDISPDYFHYFASVGSNAASVYHIHDHKVELLQGYLDEDMDEIFYACVWTIHHEQHQPLLAVAGLRGVIKIINCVSFTLENILLGHGAAINELKIHPQDENLLFSVSKDESIRLWNIKTSVCIAIFAGEKGHRDEVLSADIHMTGNCFVSVGMDTSIKIWNLKDPNLRDHIQLSYTSPRGNQNQSFSTYTEQYPLYSTSNVHDDYVDSVRWVGDLLLTKSTRNKIILWSPDACRFKGAALVLQEYTMSDAYIWYIRMDVCIPLDIFAVGNKEGKVFVFSVSSLPYEIDGGQVKEYLQDDGESGPRAPKSSTTKNEKKVETAQSKGRASPSRRQQPVPVILQHPK